MVYFNIYDLVETKLQSRCMGQIHRVSSQRTAISETRGGQSSSHNLRDISCYKGASSFIVVMRTCQAKYANKYHFISLYTDDMFLYYPYYALIRATHSPLIVTTCRLLIYWVGGEGRQKDYCFLLVIFTCEIIESPHQRI